MHKLAALAVALTLLSGPAFSEGAKDTNEGASPKSVLEKSCAKQRKENKKPGYEDEGMIPDFFMKSARGGLRTEEALFHEMAAIELKIFVLRKSPCFINKSRQFAVANNWEDGFLKVLDETFEWGENLREGDPRQVYELYKKHRTLAKEGRKYTRPIHDSLSTSLLYLADEMDLPEASFELAQSYLSKTPPDSTGRDMLKRLAHKNYAPAQLDIADRYQEGRGVEQDNAKAFYWLSRAAINGANISKERLKSLSDSLTYDDEQAVKRWLADNNGILWRTPKSKKNPNEIDP